MSETVAISTLIVDSPNYGWSDCVDPFRAAFAQDSNLQTTVSSDKDILASPELANFDVVAFGSGFTRREGDRHLPELTPAQSAGLLNAVRSGHGFFGIHTTGWFIGGEYVQLLGGHANVHPLRDDVPSFLVEVQDPKHPVMNGIDSFELSGDEIYLTAYFPEIRILAAVTWSGKRWPVVWTHEYGDGRVLYTSLGHGPATFGHPTFQRLVRNSVNWLANTNGKQI